MFTRSLENGQVQQSYFFPRENAQPIKLSPDGRFLICEYRRLHPVVAYVGGRFEWLDKWLWANKFYPENWLALVDLQTSKIWRDIVGGERCAFSDDGTRLISFTDKGRYEYNVPPQWQYFTLWAWVALGASVSLVAIWWRLRKRQPGMVAVA